MHFEHFNPTFQHKNNMINRLLILSLLFLSTLQTFGVETNTTSTSSDGIQGKVVDDRSGSPIEYANIAIYTLEDSVLVSGGITDADGRFKIKDLNQGAYFVTIKFIGYEIKVIEDINLDKDNHNIKLGEISLLTNAQNLNELDVVADKQQVQFKIDKKVVNPSQFLAAQGGSAVDILANTPSVTVDIEGNVSMRGSSNFMVLVNGKPTPFEASDALAQIPASSIENIEIITNPSAKYDPDGAAGIINIITKKDAKLGWNGIANLSVSTLGSFSGNFLFNFTGDKARWYVGANRSARLRYADYSNASGTINIDPISPSFGDTSHVVQDGERKMEFYTNSLKGGVDFDLNERNTLGIELQSGISGRGFDSDLKNREWTTGNPEIRSTSIAETKAKGFFNSFTLSQYSQFGEDKDHKLESSLFFQKYNGDDDTYSSKVDQNGLSIVTQETWEDGNQRELRLKSDYTKPWENVKLEAGYQLRIDDSWSNYDANFDTVQDNSIFYNEYSFFRMINSAYSTFSGESGQFGYQIGLRAEHTLRQLESQNDSITEINRLDFYPTIHLSYNLNENQSFMASYTRRIDRPRSYWLDPYVMWRDPNNVRKGNPELQPQYGDSYELSYQLRFKESNYFSAELFHRHVDDKIERVRSKYDDGIIMMAFENVGEDYSTGMEIMLNYELTEWWSANLSGSVYDYRIKVYPEYANSINDTQSNNWRARLSNTFKPSPTLRVQFDAMYNSASVTATGTSSGVAFTSLAVKKSFFDRKLDVGLSLIDVFNTAKMEMYGSGESYYSNYYFDMKSPFFQINLSYVFNNYKPDRNKRSDGASSMEMDF